MKTALVGRSKITCFHEAGESRMKKRISDLGAGILLGMVVMYAVALALDMQSGGEAWGKLNDASKAMSVFILAGGVMLAAWLGFDFAKDSKNSEEEMQ